MMLLTQDREFITAYLPCDNQFEFVYLSSNFHVLYAIQLE